MTDWRLAAYLKSCKNAERNQVRVGGIYITSCIDTNLML